MPRRPLLSWPQVVPLIVATFAFAAFAQSHWKQQATTLRVATHLVTVNAVVEDKDGNPVTDLKQSDFHILDGGQEQRVSFFSRFTDEQAPALPPLPPNTYTNVAAHLGNTAPSVTLILFDTLNSRKTSQGWGMEGIRKFLRQVQPGQRVGIYVLGDDLQVVQDFTQDDSDLVQALAAYDEDGKLKSGQAEKTTGTETKLDRFLEGKDVKWNRVSDSNPSVPVFGGQADGYRMRYLQQQNYLSTLALLQIVARHLVGVSGRKTLIWVSDSVPSALLSDDLQSYEDATGQAFGSFGGDIRGDIENLVRLMSQNGIAVYPVSSEGLEAMDLNFKSTDDTFNQGANLSSSVLLTPAMDKHVSAAELAKRTGGRAFYNRNDLQTGIEKALNDEKFSYSLGYYPDLKKWDGKWRKIEVKVDRPGVTVLARGGYFALPDAGLQKPKNHKAEIDYLGQIAASPVDAAQFPVYVQLAAPAGKAQLDAHVYFNPRSELRNDGSGRWKGNFEIEFMQLDATNHVLDATEKSLDVNLLPADFPRVAQQGLDMPVVIPLKARAAILCVIVRDMNSEDVGSVHIPLAKYEDAPSKN